MLLSIFEITSSFACLISVLILFSTVSIFNSKLFNLCSKISRVISLVTLESGIACLFLQGLLIGGDGNVQLSCGGIIFSSNVFPVGVTTS